MSPTHTLGNLKVPTAVAPSQVAVTLGGWYRAKPHHASPVVAIGARELDRRLGSSQATALKVWLLFVAVPV